MNNAAIVFLPKSLCFKMQTGESEPCASACFDFAIQRQRTERVSGGGAAEVNLNRALGMEMWSPADIFAKR